MIDRTKIKAGDLVFVADLEFDEGDEFDLEDLTRAVTYMVTQTGEGALRLVSAYSTKLKNDHMTAVYVTELDRLDKVYYTAEEAIEASLRWDMDYYSSGVRRVRAALKEFKEAVKKKGSE